MISPAELKALRKGANLTQRALADLIGMWPGAIGEMERGEKPIEKRTWFAVLYVVCAQPAGRQHPEVLIPRQRSARPIAFDSTR